MYYTHTIKINPSPIYIPIPIPIPIHYLFNCLFKTDHTPIIINCNCTTDLLVFSAFGVLIHQPTWHFRRSAFSFSYPYPYSSAAAALVASWPGNDNARLPLH